MLSGRCGDFAYLPHADAAWVLQEEQADAAAAQASAADDDDDEDGAYVVGDEAAGDHGPHAHLDRGQRDNANAKKRKRAAPEVSRKRTRHVLDAGHESRTRVAAQDRANALDEERARRAPLAAVLASKVQKLLPVLLLLGAACRTRR